ncbi:MAG: PEP-CTERM sorting domain-containing protein, partial [Chthoniobacterales bacterium]
DSSGTLGSITPIGGDQRQVLYINAASITNGGAASNSAMQILTGVTLQASSVYTLTVAVGNEVANPDTYKISLYVGGTLIGGNYTGGTLLASTSGSSNVITAHQLADITATYTSPSSGLISGNLAIMLTNTHASQSTVVGQETFDNVRLDVAAVPEPSSVALLCIGGIGFLSWKARRRMRLNR